MKLIQHEMAWSATKGSISGAEEPGTKKCIIRRCIEKLEVSIDQIQQNQERTTVSAQVPAKDAKQAREGP